MNPRAILWTFWLAGTSLPAADQCSPPQAAVEKLKAYFTYENGLGTNTPIHERFSVLKMGDRVFFRQNNPPPHYDPSLRPVYSFEPGRRIEGLNCPAGPTWVNCVADAVLNPHKDEGKVVYGNEPPRYTSPAPKEPTCEFTLEVPAWKPSPDNESKTKLASEILREIQGFGASEAKSIYIRDFNADDPEIEAYITNPDGQTEFLGCTLDAAKAPHCEWHGFGQSLVESLKREIMARPYRLYPPPMGEP